MVLYNHREGNQSKSIAQHMGRKLVSMADITKTALDNILREKYLITLTENLTNSGEEVLRVGGNVIALPTIDAKGNEAWIEITVKIPKGERLGKGEGFAGYDGYGLAEFYKEQTATKTAEATARKTKAAEKKAAADAKKAKAKAPKDENEEGEDA